MHADRTDSSRPARTTWEIIFLIAFAISAVWIIWEQIAIRKGFSLLTWRYLFPDSFDWLVNALRYSGRSDAPFKISHRPLFLPLIGSILFRQALEDCLIWFGFAFHVGTALLLFMLGRKIVTARAAAFAALLWFTNPSVLGQSLYVGSDVAATFFLAGGTLSLLRFLAFADVASLFLAAVFFGIGVHVQYISVILAPVLLLSLFFSSGQGTFTSVRVVKLVTSRSFYVALAAALSLIALFFYPRWHSFHILYEEGVQHESLVGFRTDQLGYYFGALLTFFSWPVLVLSAFFFLSQSAYSAKPARLFLGSWVVWIYSFFALLYGWTDVRLLIYIAPAIFVCAGAAFDMLLSAVASRLGTLVIFGALASAAIFNATTPTCDPFDVTFALTPKYALARAPTGSWSLVAAPLRSYQSCLRAEFADQTHVVSEQIESLAFSPALMRLLPALPSGVPIDFFAQLSPDERYIVQNRNVLYRRGPIRTISSVTELRSHTMTEPIVLVGQIAELAALNRAYGDYPDLSRLVATEGMFAAYQLPVSEPHVRAMPAFVKQVVAREYPERMLDGIDDNANWSASPLGEPIEVLFDRPLTFQRVRILLYDADGRFYRLRVEALNDKVWTVLNVPPDQQFSSSAEVPPPTWPIEGLRITGLYNSNQAMNPGNNVIHIRELVLEHGSSRKSSEDLENSDSF